MATLGLLLPLHTDQETGCSGYGEQYQLCRQVFFQKQQNQLLTGNTQKENLELKNKIEEITGNTQKENLELKNQIEEIKSELKNIKTQSIQQTPAEYHPGVIMDKNMITIIILVFIVTIITTIMVTKRIYHKKR